MASRKPHNKQFSIDFETQQRERWAVIQSLALPRSSLNIRLRYLIESIEGIGRGGPLRWSLADLGKRLSFPDSTLRDTISTAERLGFVTVSKNTDGKIESLSNNIAAMRQFNAEAGQRAAAAKRRQASEPPCPAKSIAEIVAATQMAAWRKAADDLEARKIPVEHVEALIAYWTANRSKWLEPFGVLYWRLINAHPSIPVEAAWRDASRSIRTTGAIEEIRQHGSQVEMERQRVAQLEQLHGSRLDSMPAGELTAIAAKCLDLDNPMLARLWRKYQSEPGPGMIRDKLLEYMAGGEVCQEF